jgi:hypothetical protein
MNDKITDLGLSQEDISILISSVNEVNTPIARKSISVTQEYVLEI